MAASPSEEAERPRRALLDRLAPGYLVCVGVFSIWVSYASFRDRVRVPISDDWRIFDDFYSMSLLQWLVSNQNGHRPTFTFGIFALDYTFFDGRQTLLVVATLATAWLVVACLYVATAVFIIVLSVCLAPALESTRERLANRGAEASEASLGLLLGMRNRPLANRMRIFGDYPKFRRVVGHLAKDRRSFFADPWADLAGSRLVDRLAVVPSKRCLGSMRKAKLFGAPARGAATIRGWVEDASGKRPSLVVVTDRASIIRGLGRVQGPGGMLPVLSSGRPDRIKWSGYLASFDPSESYVAYAAHLDARSACRLGGT